MERTKRIVFTSFVGIFTNILLVIGKILIGVIASSISIITDGINNLTDAISSVVTITGTKLANKKPNKKHPFGYGRIEYITSSIIGVIIFVAGFLAIYESIQSLINKDEPTYNTISFIIISLAIVTKIFLGLFFRFHGKKANSSALKASGLDALLDSLLSLSTLVCAIISYFTSVHIEGYVGIFIGLFIIKSSISVLKEGVSQIIGERVDSSLTNNIISDISNIYKVMGVYDLILNNYGNEVFIGSVHVEVDDKLTAKEIQLLEREIAYMCYEKYNIIMTVGIYAHSNTIQDKIIRDEVIKIVNKYPEIIQQHGFYVDHEKNILSIDIIISFENKEKDIYTAFKNDLIKKYPDYQINVVLDNDFSLSHNDEK